MRVPGLKSLKQTARWLRSQFVDSGLILGYHRVAEKAHDPYSMCVTPQHFAEQCEVLRRYVQPVSLQELVRGLQDGKLPRRAVAITFDDGYADNLDNVKSLLECYQIPTTVFVATEYIGREFWWDELERILISPAILPERLCLSVDGNTYEWVLDDAVHTTQVKEAPGSRQRLLQSLYKRLLSLSSTERQEVLAQLKAEAELDSPPYCRALMPDELVELVTGGLVDVGAHTVTHPALAGLSVEAQWSEIQRSKAYLEELLGRPVTSFSYPNGSLSEDTPRLVREAGFTCACASYNDVVWRRSDPFHLPRFWIPNWNGATFSRWLGWWLHG